MGELEGRRVQEEKGTMKCLTLVFRNVPAEVCENCGEAYVDEATARDLMRRAEEAAEAGVMVDIREYAGKAAQG